MAQLIAAIAAASVGIGNAWASEAETVVAEVELERVVSEIRASYEDAQQRLRKLPRDRLDRNWILEQAEFDADRIFDWVMKNTRWVPYRGVLRGADGVLLDRRGNSLDRSLFLGALLSDAGFDVRIVRGSLSESSAYQFLEYADRFEYVPRSTARYESAEAREIVERNARNAADLENMVDLPDAPWTSGREQDLTDHWWIEADVGAGWEAYDLQFHGARLELRPRAESRMSLDAVPEDLFQTVTIRVVTERFDEGTITEEVPLEFGIIVADRRYHDFELQFVPFGFVESSETEDGAAQIIAIADSTDEWLPVLGQGASQLVDQGFDETGNLQRSTGRLAMHRQFERAASALGGFVVDEQKSPTVLTACWLEYETRVPGRNPNIVRREIFDLIGPVRRKAGELSAFSLDDQGIRERGLALASVTRILIVGNRIPAVLLNKASLELWANHGPQLAAFARLINDPLSEELLARFHSEPLVPLDLLAYAHVRQELSRHRDAIYVGSPNVFTTHYVPFIGEDIEVVRSVDVVFNEVGVASSGLDPAALIRLEQGVLDTLLESAQAPGIGVPQNTAELFSRRGTETGPWTSFSADDDRSRLPAVARARMARAAEAGRIVVAPEWIDGAQDSAWWEIDPESGTTLGIGANGWGRATERIVVETIKGVGTRKGGEKLGREVSCRVVLAYLQSAGMTIRWLPGPNGPVPLLTPHLIQWLMSYGCRF